MNVETVIISKMTGNLVSGAPTQQGDVGLSMDQMKWFLRNEKNPYV